MKYLDHNETMVVCATVATMCLLALTLFAQPIASCIAEKDKQAIIEYRQHLTHQPQDTK
jgi:hypothetical protein